MFSTTFRYSLISLVELAREARILRTREIAARFELSPHYLSVVLRDLRRLGLVESVKGNRGGYRLLRPADQINLLELYRALAGSDGSGIRSEAAPIRSAADLWLRHLAERWDRDLEAVSLLDLCSDPDRASPSAQTSQHSWTALSPGRLRMSSGRVQGHRRRILALPGMPSCKERRPIQASGECSGTRLIAADGAADDHGSFVGTARGRWHSWRQGSVSQGLTGCARSHHLISTAFLG